jgi:hypothetical protein
MALLAAVINSYYDGSRRLDVSSPVGKLENSLHQMVELSSRKLYEYRFDESANKRHFITVGTSASLGFPRLPVFLGVF